MNKDKFKKLAQEWKRLNSKYDSYIENFFDDPKAGSIGSEKLRELKKMQKELYDLETEWFEVAEGKVNVEE